MESTRRNIAIILIVLLSGFFILHAWVGDDTYITMRVVDNATHSYGLRWNVDERVQVYTHPFWMFLLLTGYVISRHAFLTIIGVSVITAVLSICIFFLKVPRTIPVLLAAFSLLIFSKAFIDFSVSGLENPLTHLLLLLFILLLIEIRDFTDSEIFLPSLLAGLATFNRMDTVLFFLPTLLYILWMRRSFRTLGLLVAGFLPFLLWELFSLVYYGFLLPNTFYAKLNTSISMSNLLWQGLAYFKNSLLWDPLTLNMIGASLVITFVKGGTKPKLIALGILLYLLYVLYVGGDYMSGRFFSAPYFACAVLLVFLLSSLQQNYSFAVISACLVLGWFAPFPSILLPTPEATEIAIKNNESIEGITDEKAYYFQSASLIHWAPGDMYPVDKMVRRGQRFNDEEKRVSVEGTIGFIGFFGGPQLHIVDGYALGDALLARLPVQNVGKWRISHFSREIPAGYVETFEAHENRIEDPDLALYYDKLRLIISGDLWTQKRWRAIWEMNTGQYDVLLENYLTSSN